CTAGERHTSVDTDTTNEQKNKKCPVLDDQTSEDAPVGIAPRSENPDHTDADCCCGDINVDSSSSSASATATATTTTATADAASSSPSSTPSAHAPPKKGSVGLLASAAAACKGDSACGEDDGVQKPVSITGGTPTNGIIASNIVASPENICTQKEAPSRANGAEHTGVLLIAACTEGGGDTDGQRRHEAAGEVPRPNAAANTSSSAPYESNKSLNRTRTARKVNSRRERKKDVAHVVSKPLSKG
ncbi:unnamed protein product, partial [Laminaria digitata]